MGKCIIRKVQCYFKVNKMMGCIVKLLLQWSKTRLNVFPMEKHVINNIQRCLLSSPACDKLSFRFLNPT